MIPNRIYKTLGVILFISATGLFSCTKNSNSATTNTNGSDSLAANFSSSSSSADNAYNDVLQLALETGFDNNVAYMVSRSKEGGVETNSLEAAHQPLGIYTCATYTVSPNDTSTFPKTITVNFGSGCTSPDGITRKGVINFAFTGKLLYPGTTVTVSFTNYFVNGYGLQGTYSITNNSSLIKGISFTTQVTGGTITFPDESFYTYAGTKTITQTAGSSTPSNISDDVYSISGSNTFANSASGNSLQDSITTALTKDESCGYISSGVISFVFNTTIKGSLDFGDGTCDSLATVKVGPFTENVTLK